MALGGPNGLVQAALDRLDLVADTYLSVASPVQRATAGLLQLAPRIREQISARLTGEPVDAPANRGFVSGMRGIASRRWVVCGRARACDAHRRTAGRWHSREQARVIVYPGYFFDFERDGYLVVSLLVIPADFARGIARLFETID